MGLLMYQSMEEIAFPSVQEFKAFNPSKLCLFLKHRYRHRQDFFHFFDILEQQGVDGEGFMGLTREHVQGSPFKFSLGCILLIEELIKKLKEDTDVGCIESSIGKNSVTENSANSKLNDVDLLRRLFKGIADSNAFTFKAICDEIKSTNHSISETTLSNFYYDDSDLNPSNKIAVRKWVERFIDEWKKDGRSLTILVKLDPA